MQSASILHLIGKKDSRCYSMADATLAAPPESAKEAGLRYVSDADTGICRKRRGKGFTYVDSNGETVRDQKTLARVRSLVIPPAWKHVWICASPNGHLQATGRDAKGRKQSRYHPRWREVRDETKYERMLSFGAALTTIRAHVELDVSAPGLPRRKIIASIVRLMETTLIRVGNEEYARNNHSYGLTTMHDRHARVEGSTITFKFKGKSGKSHTVDVNDRRLAKIIRRCQDIPGYELFQYIDEESATHSVDSADVNDYLREISKQDFTAKDFRTWAGSVLAYSTLRLLDPFESATQAKKNVVETIKSVAERLGNTPSVCRKCYVHPALLDCYLAGSLNGATKNGSKPAGRSARASRALSTEESGLIHLLERVLPHSNGSTGRK
jgi:DNA topoisomerase-1